MPNASNGNKNGTHPKTETQARRINRTRESREPHESLFPSGAIRLFARQLAAIRVEFILPGTKF